MKTEYWYVFFVWAGLERKATDEIQSAFDGGEVNPLNLTVEILFKKQKKVLKEIRPMFPGYVFIASPIENDEFVKRVKDCVHRSKSIIKLLRYGDTNQAAMREDERLALDYLCQGKYFIETSKGFIVGDRIVITQGPFVGRESIIKEIHRHKMQATIELEFLGGIQKAVIGLEIVRKFSESIN